MDFLNVGYIVLQAIALNGGDLESAVSLKFNDPARVCLRAPYGDCGISRCDKIDDNQMALDIQTLAGNDSLVFSRTLGIEGSADERTILPREECRQIDTDQTVFFLVIQKRMHTVSVTMETR